MSNANTLTLPPSEVGALIIWHRNEAERWGGIAGKPGISDEGQHNALMARRSHLHKARLWQEKLDATETLRGKVGPEDLGDLVRSVVPHGLGETIDEQFPSKGTASPAERMDWLLDRIHQGKLGMVWDCVGDFMEDRRVCVVALHSILAGPHRLDFTQKVRSILLENDFEVTYRKMHGRNVTRIMIPCTQVPRFRKAVAAFMGNNPAGYRTPVRDLWDTLTATLKEQFLQPSLHCPAGLDKAKEPDTVTASPVTTSTSTTIFPTVSTLMEAYLFFQDRPPQCRAVNREGESAILRSYEDAEAFFGHVG